MFPQYYLHSLQRFQDDRMDMIIFCIFFKILDPIFPLMFLVNSWIPGMFDAIFQATFLGALLLFWLCLYHGVRQVGYETNIESK